MKLTDDIVRALHGCIEDGFDSVADFARNANVSVNTIMKYIRKESNSIKRDTWLKILPFIQNYMPKNKGGGKHGYELDTDEKILLDAFSELPDDLRNQKLLEIVELAKKCVRESQGEDANDSTAVTPSEQQPGK